MSKKNIVLGAVAALGIMGALSGAGQALAAEGASGNFNGMGRGMMRNLSESDRQKMIEAHRLMAEGNYTEARGIMQGLGMGNCPMLGGTGGGMGKGMGMMGGRT